MNDNKLNSILEYLAQFHPMAGTIQMYAGQEAPAGWLVCDGSAISRTEYSKLFEVIGLTYGAGDGNTTFNLPDMRGRVPVGVGTGTATDATAHILGQVDGEESHIITADEMAAHTHGSKALTGSVNIRDCGTAAGYNTIMTNKGIVTSIVKEVWSGSHDVLSSQSVTNPNTQKMTINATHEHNSVGLNEAHNNMQPYIVINYIISTGLIKYPEIEQEGNNG